MRGGGAVDDAFGLARRACDLRAPAHEAERAAFGEELSAEGAAAFFGDDVDDAAHGVRAVERGAGAAEDFDSARVCDGEVGEEAGGVALRRGRVAEALAVNEDGRILTAQAARLDGGERAGAAELLHAQAGHGAQSVRDRRLVAVFHLAPAYDREGLRYFVNGLRRVSGCDDDFG